MPALISGVVEDSIAQELEIEEGDILLSIDGEKLQDMIDYRFMCKSEFLTIEIQKKNGEIEEIELEKDYDDDRYDDDRDDDDDDDDIYDDDVDDDRDDD